MVRKVEGNKPSGASGTAPIQSTKTVESAKVGSVEQVKETTGRASVGGVRRSTRIMSAKEQQQLFQMIDEEAEKMFGSGMTESRKRKVTGAVKMAIEASIIKEDEEE